MKKKISIAVIVLLLSQVSLFFGGCGKKVKYDPTKTQLFIHSQEGGFGSEYVREISNAFAEEFKDVSFEEGKTGVEPVIEAHKGESLNRLWMTKYDVVFGESVQYYDLAMQGNIFLDISDIINDILPGEGKSINDKLRPAHKSMIPAIDGKYYALPSYEYFFFLCYDADLFEEKRLYFADNKSNGNDGFILSATDKRSAGPDGEYNTYDDGLPVTIEDFFKLCSYMRQRNVTPFIWTGEYPAYIRKFLRQLMGVYDGKNFSSNFTFSGQSEIVTGMTGNSVKLTNNFSMTLPQTQTMSISPETGYRLNQSAGRYYSLAFLEAMLSDPGFYDPRSFSQVESHLQAQEDYIYSRLENEPIAMLVEGNYWENEAKGAFARSEKDYPNTAKNRRFAVMPLPRLDETSPFEKYHNMDNAKAYLFINQAGVEGNEGKVKLAKEFLKFFYRDINLQTFTTITGTTIAADYKLTDAQYNGLSFYRKSVWDYLQNSEMVYQASGSEFYIRNSSTLEQDMLYYNTRVGSASYSFAQTAMRNSGVSAINYFNGMAVAEQTWRNKYAF